MKILFELSHPKHYYQFRFLIFYFSKIGEVLILAREKDVLLNILEEENLQYIVLGKHGKGLISKFLVLPKILLNYIKIVRKFKPDYVISKASPYAVFVKYFIKGKVVITPDSEVVLLTKRIVAPLSDLIITPLTYSIDYGIKHKRIDGFFEETYLSPKSFLPDEKILSKYKIDGNKPFYVLRFVSWEANHDIGQFGFSNEEKIQLVKLLKNYGTVYISSEHMNVPPEIAEYILRIEARDIHHILAYANAYIGDSQTMATESALLGTPSFRYNSFVGKNDMSNFISLEKEFGLLKNFGNFNNLVFSLKELLHKPDSKKDWLQKRKKYFDCKPDLNEQILSILDIYF